MSAATSRFSMGGVLSFNTTGAVANMGRAHTSFLNLRQSISRSSANITSGLSEIALGLSRIGVLGAAAAIGVGKTFADFEKQMSVLFAVTGDIEKDYFGKYITTARQLGRETVFTATQVGGGMEQLKRAGFGAQEVLSAIPGVLNMAAAEGMGLAQASTIVASTLRAFGLEADQARNVADKFAATSVNSATNIADLSSALRYGQFQAANMGISLDDTVRAMGLMANASLRGSRAGTSFGQLLMAIASRTPLANKRLEEMGVTLEDTSGNFIGLFGSGGLVEQVRRGIQVYSTELERAGAIKDIFNNRGLRAMTALLRSTDTAVESTSASFRRLNKGIAEATDGIGTSAKMAQTMLDNIKGDFTLLTSAMSDVAIGMGTVVGNTFRGFLKNIISFTRGVGASLVYFQTESGDRTDEMVKAFMAATNSAKQVAEGLTDGLERLEDTGRKMVNMFLRIFKQEMGSTDKSIKEMTSNIVHVVGVLGVGAPGSMGLYIALRMATGALRTFKGVWGLAFSGAALPIAGVLLALQAIKKDGESTFETLIRVASRFKKIIEGIVGPLRSIQKTLGIGDLTMLAGILGAGYGARRLAGSSIVRSTLFGTGAKASTTLAGMAIPAGVTPVWVVNNGGVMGSAGGAGGAGSSAAAAGSGGLVGQLLGYLGGKFGGHGSFLAGGAGKSATMLGVGAIATTVLGAIAGSLALMVQSNEAVNEAQERGIKLGLELQKEETRKKLELEKARTNQLYRETTYHHQRLELTWLGIRRFDERIDPVEKLGHMFSGSTHNTKDQLRNRQAVMRVFQTAAGGELGMLTELAEFIKQRAHKSDTSDLLAGMTKQTAFSFALGVSDKYLSENERITKRATGVPFDVRGLDYRVMDSLGYVAQNLVDDAVRAAKEGQLDLLKSVTHQFAMAGQGEEIVNELKRLLEAFTIMPKIVEALKEGLTVDGKKMNKALGENVKKDKKAQGRRTFALPHRGLWRE